MYFDWDRHWWLIIILAALAVPIVQAIFEPWNRYLRYRRQRDAMEALKIYAASGREPPAAVLAALGGSRFRWQAAADTVAEATDRATDRRSRRQDRWERRIEYRMAGEPLRRWNWAIFAGSVTLGFGLAWRYAHQNNDAYLIVAVIAGALTFAGVITALLATFWRLD